MPLIDKQMAIDALCDNCDNVQAVCAHYPCEQYIAIDNLTSAQLTLHGYSVEHLVTIAMCLQKENLPPERVIEMLTDVSRIVKIVTDEFEKKLMEALRKEITQ